MASGTIKDGLEKSGTHEILAGYYNDTPYYKITVHLSNVLGGAARYIDIGTTIDPTKVYKIETLVNIPNSGIVGGIDYYGDASHYCLIGVSQNDSSKLIVNLQGYSSISYGYVTVYYFK